MKTGFLVLGGVVAAGLALLTRSESSPSPRSARPPKGNGSESTDSDDVIALARMLASETRKTEAWPWMAVAVRNAAAARHVSIYKLLRTVKGQEDDWGSNAGGHWASTIQRPTAASLDFARRWFRGEIPDPPGSEGVRSFYEVEERGKKHDPGSFLARNPELALADELAGWQFYRREQRA